MKNVVKLFAFAIVAIGLSACGSSNNQTGQYGQQGYRDANGNWVQTGYGANGNNCISPGQPANLLFSVQGAAVNSAVILAGTLPQNSTRPGQYGQVVMGQVQQQNYAGLQLVKQSSSGTMQLSVGQGTVSGQIALSPAITAQLAGVSQNQQYPSNNYNSGYNNSGYNQQICITSLAIDAVYSATPTQGGYYQQQQNSGVINQALVYLTLSSGQTVGPIPFY
jgi:hypothetical protein